MVLTGKTDVLRTGEIMLIGNTEVLGNGRMVLTGKYRSTEHCWNDADRGTQKY